MLEGCTGSIQYTSISLQCAGTCHPLSPAWSLSETIVRVHFQLTSHRTCLSLGSSLLPIEASAHPGIDCKAEAGGLGAEMQPRLLCKEWLPPKVCQHRGGPRPDVGENRITAVQRRLGHQDLHVNDLPF